MVRISDHVFFVGDGLCMLTIEIDNLGTSNNQGLEFPGASKNHF